ncbi:UbiA family prenyltransferase [Streptomyces sp. NPDC006997]|uniref:UbiA prenyltransferase family protein n=1 Tax=Streptomyces sp. NPDC006997 TaxID=3155356 RepID=UPI0033C4268C
MATLTAQVSALYGFSRGTQATLSVAQPMTAALLSGATPANWRFAVFCLGCLAGFFSVFAVNDLLDSRLDRRRFANVRDHDGPDIDAVGGRHPLARGRLSRPAAVLWVVGLAAVAAGVCALFSRVSLLLFLGAVALEIVYCRLATVTVYKTVVSGVMVAMGALVGWFALSRDVDAEVLSLLVLWLAAWEIGGRNIPNDLADLDEDVHLGIATIPVRHGAGTSAHLSFAALAVAACASVGLVCVAFPATTPSGALCLTLAALAAAHCLITPGRQLLRSPDGATALTVFNRASLHPALVLAVVILGLSLR